MLRTVRPGLCILPPCSHCVRTLLVRKPAKAKRLQPAILSRGKLDIPRLRRQLRNPADDHFWTGAMLMTSGLSLRILLPVATASARYWCESLLKQNVCNRQSYLAANSIYLAADVNSETLPMIIFGISLTGVSPDISAPSMLITGGRGAQA